jgi:hypothetical protein
VDVLMHMAGGEACVWSPRGELRFAPGGELTDGRGRGWSVEGDAAALALELGDGRALSSQYPDALERIWSALTCHQTGDVLVSAGGGYEFVDWGGVAHVGGGSHGSLHRGDSLGVMLFCGVEPPGGKAPEQWRIRDATPMALEHFAVAS